MAQGSLFTNLKVKRSQEIYWAFSQTFQEKENKEFSQQPHFILSWANINTCVPQGSTLGPLLFLPDIH